MTDLIPRDAAIDYAMNVAVFSPRASQSEINAAVLVLARVDTALRAIPAIDPAAIREAAQALEQECPWRDDTASYREWHEDRHAIATRLLALIGEKK